VIDPTTKRVMHLVVKAQGESWVERLVPVELADPGDGARSAVTLRAMAEEVGSLSPAREIAYLQLGDFPLDDPDWDVGIQEVYALPYYPASDLEPGPLDFPVTYDRIPKGGVEIRRTSDVYSAGGHHLGHVDGFLVDRDEHITHPAAAAAAREAGGRFENALEDLGTRLAIARHRLAAELTNDRRLFERAVEAELRDWRVHGERLRQGTAAKGGSADERSQLALAEPESRRDDARRLREMRTASDETWPEQRERVDAALDGLEHATDGL
jgi:hypothetical protein